MYKKYDFTDTKRTQDAPQLARLQESAVAGKVRITMYVDMDVLAAFRQKAEAEGKGYQTMMNSALRETIMPGNAPVTVETLRKIIREELHTS